MSLSRLVRSAKIFLPAFGRRDNFGTLVGITHKGRPSYTLLRKGLIRALTYSPPAAVRKSSAH